MVYGFPSLVLGLEDIETGSLFSLFLQKMSCRGQEGEGREKRKESAQPPKLCEEVPQLVKLCSPYVSEAEAAHRFTGA